MRGFFCTWEKNDLIYSNSSCVYHLCLQTWTQVLALNYACIKRMCSFLLFLFYQYKIFCTEPSKRFFFWLFPIFFSWKVCIHYRLHLFKPAIISFENNSNSQWSKLGPNSYWSEDTEEFLTIFDKAGNVGGLQNIPRMWPGAGSPVRNFLESCCGLLWVIKCYK